MGMVYHDYRKLDCNDCNIAFQHPSTNSPAIFLPCWNIFLRLFTAKIRGEFEPEDPDAQSTHTNNFDHCSNLQLYKS